MTPWRVLGTVTLLLAAGCSDPKKNEPSDGAAGTSSAAGSGNTGSGGDGSASEAGAGAGGTGAEPAAACNDLVLDAPVYALGQNSKPHNIPEGGVIPDGTYFITAQIMFETETGPMLDLGRTKVTIAGDVWQEVSGDAEADGVNPDRRSTSSLSTSGTTLELTRTCPSQGEPESAEYSVDDGGFTIYVTEAGTPFGTIFTRQ